MAQNNPQVYEAMDVDDPPLHSVMRLNISVPEAVHALDGSRQYLRETERSRPAPTASHAAHVESYIRQIGARMRVFGHEAAISRHYMHKEITALKATTSATLAEVRAVNHRVQNVEEELRGAVTIINDIHTRVERLEEGQELILQQLQEMRQEHLLGHQQINARFGRLERLLIRVLQLEQQDLLNA
ncbi:uncharacterized protein LOC129600479 [Paramacrobiotus metropolitanus]|uniref:uncharacterized protein LOC129600479 n=1 Tax=Paramacrobiotus metropolitanus TaxID=2943436 RepID=UPI0024461D98|nr:uncharacterized protein LOC129600479 [Paramacrobiotus metropolitanus]XP_055354988.1 uncharacterized protein LOC129600479 [Paramacrobiotus metropolitanus]XP_055354989.1 uncharacterized protein LOC129600479 [Paramacrobiotus metropolitanus]